jgi:hypothetical protein
LFSTRDNACFVIDSHATSYYLKKAEIFLDNYHWMNV